MAALEAKRFSVNAETINKAIHAVISELESITTIKKEQEYALGEFIVRKYVFAVRPTGFGKSLIHQLAPLVFNKLYPDTNPTFIVASPLVALMEDQIRHASKLGIIALQIGVHNDRDIQHGCCQLVLHKGQSRSLVAQ